MYQTPAATYGSVPVVVTFWLYVGLALSVALLASELGASGGASFAVFLLAAIGLLKLFLPLFRRLLPTARHER
ncbi:hypothetical protein SAMN04487948_104282 [Halogranum amylolyticum]|uniref:Uncharacterized protein n=1 Tax=Halogranum amylolyticum TaxID=660520 RepID=A0A1H8RWW4_9EURY|nr:hypothetical protein [Halogranum amylolyticum]SEO70694.1 hypothetical protein SAMN04487948_104282 [Halogranum amylolyticum]